MQRMSAVANKKRRPQFVCNWMRWNDCKKDATNETKRNSYILCISTIKYRCSGKILIKIERPQFASHGQSRGDCEVRGLFAPLQFWTNFNSVIIIRPLSSSLPVPWFLAIIAMLIYPIYKASVNKHAYFTLLSLPAILYISSLLWCISSGVFM